MTIDPRQVELPCESRHLSMPAEGLVEFLRALARKDLSAFDDNAGASDLLEQLHAADNPVLVGGADLLGVAGVDALCSAAANSSTDERNVGVMTLLAGPNSFAGAMLAGDGPVFDTLLDNIQEGKIKAMVCLENDPFREPFDPSRAQAALGRLEVLVVFDHVRSMAVQRADIVLPTRATAEMAGSFINNEGRLQTFLPVIDPGVPIRETGQGDHPPREFFHTTPGSLPEAGWALLARLLERTEDLVALRHSIAANDPRLTALTRTAPESTGERIAFSGNLPPSIEKGLVLKVAKDALSLLAISAPLGSHWLAHLSRPLAETEPQPYVLLHPKLAREQGLENGDRARLTTHFGHCSVDILVNEKVDKHQVLVPQLWGTALEGMVAGSIYECRLDKEVRA